MQEDILTPVEAIKEDKSFKRSLGLVDATMVVAGSMIGSGIFIVSADITRNVGSAGWLIAVWLITGFMTLVAAISYGELSGMFPKAGGQYVYLKEAYNSFVSFLYGWSLFAVIQTGTIAAVGVAFSRSNSLGIMFSYGSANAPYYAYNATTPNQPDFTGQLKNYSVLLNLVRYMPTGTNVITPYLRTAFGINVWDQHYLDATGNKIPTAIPDPPTFAYQVGLGAKLRFDKHTGAFIEAGYGKYIVSAGLSFKLTR